MVRLHGSFKKVVPGESTTRRTPYGLLFSGKSPRNAASRWCFWIHMRTAKISTCITITTGMATTRINQLWNESPSGSGMFTHGLVVDAM